MKNCWSFALNEFDKYNGWLLVRFTRRSSSKPSLLFRWFGVVLIFFGAVAINFGSWMRSGRWLHVYHAHSVKGPYRSYEPSNGGPKIKRPPFNFKGSVKEHTHL